MIASPSASAALSSKLTGVFCTIVKFISSATGGVLILIVTVSVLESPPASVTVRVIVRVPAVGNMR